MDALADPFEFPTAETNVTMEGGLQAPLAGGGRRVLSRSRTASSANMNTAAEVMRADWACRAPTRRTTRRGVCLRLLPPRARRLLDGASLAGSAGRKRTLPRRRCTRSALSASSALARCAPGAPCAGRRRRPRIGGRVDGGGVRRDVGGGADVPGRVSPPHLRASGRCTSCSASSGCSWRRCSASPPSSARASSGRSTCCSCSCRRRLLALRSRLAGRPSGSRGCGRRRRRSDPRGLRGERDVARRAGSSTSQVSGSAGHEIPGYKYGVRQMLRTRRSETGWRPSSAPSPSSSRGSTTPSILVRLPRAERHRRLHRHPDVLMNARADHALSASPWTAGRRPLPSAADGRSALGLTAALTHRASVTPAVAVVTSSASDVIRHRYGPIPWLLPLGSSP